MTILISALLNLVYAVLSVLLVFNLPSLPDSVVTVANSVIGYITTGIDILRVFVGDTCMGIIALLFGLVLAMNVAYMLYSLVFWVIRKIPMFNVRE